MHRANARAANFANFAACQAGWFACVIGAAHGMPAAGVGAAALVVAVHMALVADRKSELTLLAAAGMMGLVFDGALAASGWIAYAPGWAVSGPAPDWILALWLLFALMLRHALAWLAHRPVLACVLGAGGGPLAYLAGERLGALRLAEPTAALAALAIGWAAGTPALFWLSSKLSR